MLWRCKMLHFFAALFLTGVELHLSWQNATLNCENFFNSARFEFITTRKSHYVKWLILVIYLVWSYFGIFLELFWPNVYFYTSTLLG